MNECPNEAIDKPILMDIAEILKILPQRFPILLVDRILEIDLEKNTILGQKNVTINEHYFEGHFPGAPIMPGVLILEALAQTGGIMLHQKGFGDKIALFLSLNNVKFRNPVKPGDVLHLYCEGMFFSSKGGRVKARATVGSKTAVEAEIGFALADKNLI
ncbi:MAG: 3-hydroxyacyl-ACP dehydratase FabZ [Chlamydiia bacterium]|nr:3-hydroxyacyl-ACP dehydratase FabZ [Chlamydiia bacterium]